MTAIDATLLRSIAPQLSGARGLRQAAIIDAIGPILNETLAKYEIDTPLRVAHFLAQVGHESAGFSTTEEFAAGSAYEGRRDLGNTAPGDGQRYKGRGLIQITGRANYALFGSLLGLDLLDDPMSAAQPEVALSIACVFWQTMNLNVLADADDLAGITRRINGALNGLDSRAALLKAAKAALGLREAAWRGVTFVQAPKAPPSLPCKPVCRPPVSIVRRTAFMDLLPRPLSDSFRLSWGCRLTVSWAPIPGPGWRLWPHLNQRQQIDGNTDLGRAWPVAIGRAPAAEMRCPFQA